MAVVLEFLEIVRQPFHWKLQIANLQMFGNRFYWNHRNDLYQPVEATQIA